MWREWRIQYDAWGQWGILALECALFALAMLWTDGPADAAPHQIALGLALVLGLWAWWRVSARARSFGNTPAARIAAAAQGYTALAGRGQLIEGTPRVFEPGTGLPCLWRRVSYRSGEGGSNALDESDASFVLDDGSGAVCAVDPEGATMLARRHKIEYQEDGACVEYWYLLPGDPIYVLGEFVTVGSISPDLETHRQTGELLELWKADRPELLRRFDLNGNGELSQQEWDLARAAARREVERTQQQALNAAQAHLMRKPGDGQLYLISDRDPAALARRFRFWAIVHGLVFIAAAVALAWSGVRSSGI